MRHKMMAWSFLKSDKTYMMIVELAQLWMFVYKIKRD